jgi:hypothetical protein
LPTSRGEAKYFTGNSEEPRTPGCVSAIACAPEALNISVEANGHQMDVCLDGKRLCLDLLSGMTEERAR